ncbi:hypothetical protein GH714_001165 [Hevea brasiliensis]|uniref:Uncharacterized protein n=1 Tax=Hevea brasiliensis TaxID=3981 RepID=A0A6A6M9S6_HEVBR|nr:hypothetical protein GH714_001165 [Hevea brasiliensis]
MGSELVDLPMKLLMPSSSDNIKEIAFKTIPSMSKVEIKRVLSSYGFEVEKNPLSIAADLFPAYAIEKERTSSRKHSKSSYVQEDDVKSHWLDKEECRDIPEKHSWRGSSNLCTIGTLGQVHLSSSESQYSSRDHNGIYVAVAIGWVQGVVQARDAESQEVDLSEFGVLVADCRPLLAPGNLFSLNWVAGQVSMVAHTLARLSCSYACFVHRRELVGLLPKGDR